jgi:hypothetical protein
MVRSHPTWRRRCSFVIAVQVTSVLPFGKSVRVCRLGCKEGNVRVDDGTKGKEKEEKE